MLRLKKKTYISRIYMLFIVFLLAAAAIFGVRVFMRYEVTPMSIGQTLLVGQDYHFGTVYDRNGNVIVSGTDYGVDWGSENTQKTFETMIGVDAEKIFLSRMTILGNCPWLLGTEDNRWGLNYLLNPMKKRVGGGVRLTIDKGLQEYIAELLDSKGFENAYVLVSDYSTGEILAAYGEVFSALMHPGSTLKPILAAAMLEVNPEMKNFVYECSPDHHDFKTENGWIRINCAGDSYHGTLSMEDALACSCNGYFLQMMSGENGKSVMDKMKQWGFDNVVSYRQFMYWDHTLTNGSHNKTDYLMAVIGQGNAYITPAGLHFFTSGLLNEGELIEPVWYTHKQSMANGDWEDILEQRETRFCDADVANQVLGMMEQVCIRGTGTSFYMPGLAAKTGTAQKADETGALTDYQTIWTTGGLRDKETPYSITVCIDNVPIDVKSYEAGKVAADILNYVLEGEE